jgi:hypothetical protein
MSHVSGLQAAQVGLVRLLETWSSQFSPREFATRVDLLVRWLEREAPKVELPLGSATCSTAVRQSA